MQADTSTGKEAFLSPFGAWGLAFGFTVGWGAFVMPGTTFLPGAGPLGTAVGVLLGAAAMLVFAWNYHVLVKSRPGPGGAFAYAHDVLGPDYGFLVAWSLLLAYLAILWANATALVLLVRFVAGNAFQVGFHYRLAGFDVWLGEAGFCVAAIAAAGALCLAKRSAARVNLGLVLVLSGCVAACFAAAVAKHRGGWASMAPPFAPGTGRPPARQVLAILGMMPWAFVGFEAISNLSGEFAFDRRRTFRLLAGAVAAAAAAYVALALLPALAHPDAFSSWPDYLAGAKRLGGVESMPTFAAARRALGAAGVAVLAAAMFAGISTGVIASVLATSRLLRGLSEYRVFPAWIAAWTPAARRATRFCWWRRFRRWCRFSGARRSAGRWTCRASGPPWPTARCRPRPSRRRGNPAPRPRGRRAGAASGCRWPSPCCCWSRSTSPAARSRPSPT